MNPYWAMVLGIACSCVGGELFVRGIVGLSRWMRVSAGITGATVAAFGTSAPELSVGVMAGLAGTPHVSLGDVLGSNIVNVALIMGIVLVIGGRCRIQAASRRDLAFAFAAPATLLLLGLVGGLSRFDGLILFLIFCVWLAITLREARRQRSTTEKMLGGRRGALVVVSCGLGLVLLIASGRLIVLGAKGIAAALRFTGFIVGALIVAVGTSIPELATAIISKLKGYEEVGLGTILGSNIFNGLFIIAVVVAIHPTPVPWPATAVAIAFGIVTLAVLLPTKKGAIDRWRGVVLLALYALYIVFSLR